MKKEIINEEKAEVKTEELELQTTLNSDGLDVLCEDADVENEEKEGE